MDNNNIHFIRITKIEIKNLLVTSNKLPSSMK